MRDLLGARVKPVQPKEFTLQVSVADLLDRWATPGWRWTHLPFGEHRNEVTGARLKRMGTKRGWPDFILLAPELHESRAHFLELKRPKGKPTDEQKELRDWMRANGYEWEMADDLKTAIAILSRWGAVRTKISA